MAAEGPLAAALPRLPALVVVTDASGGLRWCAGELAETLAIEAGALDYIGTLFTRPSAIFLETHLWPLLRREGRIDECFAPLRRPDGSPWPCLVSARAFSEGAEARVLWLFFSAHERVRFEAELIAARGTAQRLAGELAEANSRLLMQTEAVHERNLELDQLASTDPLTGLGNRRALESAFRTWLAQAVPGIALRGGAMLMIDADHFKAINDRWGHDVGDEVLVRLAATLRASIRRSDSVVRVGGEEFALWLPDATHDVAGRVADDLHARLGSFFLPDGSSQLTVSVGVALLDSQPDPTDLHGLMKRADDALYVAKAEGRHCTRWASSSA